MGSSSTSTNPTIGLPQGGGALQGIGETFAPDLHTGTGNFSIPIALPPGRNGLQPQLALSYGSGSGNGPFGLGWSLAVPTVTRKTSKGVPRYRDRSDLAQRDTFILAGSEDLVPVAGAAAPFRYYRPRSEGLFARIAHDESADLWEVSAKDGMVSRYGLAQADGVRAVVADPARPERIFAWYLSETVDTFGNRITYEYWRDRDASRRFDQLYLARIRYADYGADRFLVSVSFEYEERPDPFSDCRAGFEIRTRHRCKRIAIRTDADRERLVRSYDLAYRDDAGNAASLLASITATGHDDERPDGTEALPPVEFRYTAFEPERRKFFPLRGDDLPARSLAAGGIELVDLFGRGLPDFLEMNGTVRYWRNRGNGAFDRPRQMTAAPAGLRLGDPGVELVDADGNGRADLMVTASPSAGYYPLSFEGRFDERSFKRFPQAPSFDLRDPKCRLVDLDGDGVTDAIRSGTRLECFFHRPGEGWNETRVVDRSALSGLPGIDFADPRLRWADMNGDGLQDIVLIHNGRIEYWPYLGYGQWGEPVRMTGCPRFPDAAIYGSTGYDTKRLLLGDVDGDGAADLVYVGNGEVTLWINQAGNGWSDPIVIRGTPRVTDIDSVRLVDLLGNGIAGLLWSTDKEGGHDNLRFLDFTGGTKPYLLDELNNNTGALTRVAYKPSTFFYLADERLPQTRWKTPLPFPVQVVARTEAIDQISGGRLTTEYSYHHGFWDGGEREFRGFGRVDHRDTEVFQPSGTPSGQTVFATDGGAHSPPMETRTWFHQGAIGDADDWTYAERTHEFWSGDPSMFARPPEVDQTLAVLPAQARRDALRALRGRILRTELYALDGTLSESLPYTVSEHQYALREVDAPAGDASRKRIFFVFTVGERTSRWERGEEPMHHFGFTADYDDFGQPRNQIAIAVPRGRDPGAVRQDPWPEPYLVTQSVTAFAAPNETPFIADRVAHVTSYEIAGERTRSVPQLRDALLAGTGVERKVIGQTLSFYDGPAFEGRPLGMIGARGALMRSEALVLTPEILAAAYSEGLPPCFVDGAADWSEYPDAFRTALPPNAGYLRRTAASGSPVVAGLYAVTVRREYDFQRTNDTARGLMRRTLDPLGHETIVTYDSPYALLPVETVDAAGLQTSAVYDYRVLQPREVIDANGNHSVFTFRPLGLVESAAVMGKGGEAAGDTPDQPSVRHVYDFHAYLTGQPISVRTIRRVHHATETAVPLPERDATIETVEYRDGFGRLLQTRSQAEDVLFGDAAFGGGVLPADPHDDAGTRRDVAPPPRNPTLKPNVVISGAQTYDNKGRVVERYEPYFDIGWQYRPPAANQFGQKATLYYDARGELVRTVNPDGSELTVVHGIPYDLADPYHFAPTPWETYSYGANDNAGRTPAADPNSAGYDHHWNTPGSTIVDALGRTVVTVERNRARRANPGDPLPPVETLRSTATYDIGGNALAVTDALGRTVARHVYDLANRALRGESLDAGMQRSVIDAAGRAVEVRDAKGALALRSHDALNRPVFVWARDRAGLLPTLRERLVYGDAAGLADAAQQNLLGRLYRHYDEAGLLSIDACDFKGNVLEKSRRSVLDQHLLATIGPETTGGPPPAVAALSAAATAVAPDGLRGDRTASPVQQGGKIAIPPPPEVVVWHAAPFRIDWQPPAGTSLDDYAATLLDAADTTSLQYDALNRVQQLLYPADASGARRALHPTYNRAGWLERVQLDGDTYVERIAYNARGQRTLIVYGNGAMSRHAYDPRRLRLVRLRSERCTQPSATVYHPSDADSPLQDLAYAYDLDGNILGLTDRTPGSGVLNNPDAAAWVGLDPQLAAQLAAGDALVRRFAYDPLGRLESATGRACSAIPSPRPWDDAPSCGYGSGAHGTPSQDNAPALTALYRETYAYDPAGNLLRLRNERGGTASVRNFGIGGRTPAGWDAEWRQHASGGPWPSAPGNQLTHVGDDSATVPQSHVFDPAGNLLHQNADRHFLWDAANRLRLFCVQVVDPLQPPGETRGAEPSIAAHYLYDAAGQRVKKLVRTQGGAYETTVYIDGIFERRSWAASGATSATTTVHHVMDDTRRIAQVRSGAQHPQDRGPPVQYHLGDHLDSSVIVIDGDGAWINREEFSPYGETTFGGFARKRYRFGGKERDVESGLNYHGARYYAPWLARWVSCDPAGMVDGPNLFAFVRNNPIRHSDPSGLQVPPVAATGATVAPASIAGGTAAGSTAASTTAASTTAGSIASGGNSAVALTAEQLAVHEATAQEIIVSGQRVVTAAAQGSEAVGTAKAATTILSTSTLMALGLFLMLIPGNIFQDHPSEINAGAPREAPGAPVSGPASLPGVCSVTQAAPGAGNQAPVSAPAPAPATPQLAPGSPTAGEAMQASARPNNQKFMKQALKKILADPDHPLKKLVDYDKKNWRSREKYSHAPTVQAGHQVSLHGLAQLGLSEQLSLEDSTFNQWSSNIGETQGCIYFKPAIDIGGIPVERRTAEMWQETGVLENFVLRIPPQPRSLSRSY